MPLLTVIHTKLMPLNVIALTRYVCGLVECLQRLLCNVYLNVVIHHNLLISQFDSLVYPLSKFVRFKSIEKGEQEMPWELDAFKIRTNYKPKRTSYLFWEASGPSPRVGPSPNLISLPL